mmetsp:Transcript_84808/g.236655  ORF Transcript_84808/g.236655 Transcript_84808/m.236655 type:complete len:85 (+) Transcript_84808:3-257(+)
MPAREGNRKVEHAEPAEPWVNQSGGDPDSDEEVPAQLNCRTSSKRSVGFVASRSGHAPIIRLGSSSLLQRRLKFCDESRCVGAK